MPVTIPGQLDESDTDALDTVSTDTPTERPSLETFKQVMKERAPQASDRELHQYWSQHYSDLDPNTLPAWTDFQSKVKAEHPDTPDESLREYWDVHYGDFGAREKAPDGSTLLRRAADVPVGLVKGVVDLPKIAVGLGDMVTDGAMGRGTTAVLDVLGKEADQIGLPSWARPSQWSEQLRSLYSPETQAAVKGASESTRQSVEEAKAEGVGPVGEIWAGVKGTAKGLAQHPGAVVPLVAENIAQMGVIAKGTALLLKPFAASLNAEVVAGVKTAEEANALLGKAAVKYASAGEGILSAGQVSSQISEANPEADFVHRLAAVVAGVTTATITRGVAKIPGLGDIEASMAAKSLGRSSGFAGSLPERLSKGVLAEGVLQELPQSAQEQLWQNLATGKPWQEGLGEQAVQGLVAGGVLGGAGAAYAGSSVPPEPPPPTIHTDTIPAAMGVGDQSVSIDDAIAIAAELVKAPTTPRSATGPTLESGSVEPNALSQLIERGGALPNQAELLDSARTRQPYDTPILPGPDATDLQTIAPGRAFTPKQPPSEDPRAAIAAERERLAGMRRPPTMSELPSSPELIDAQLQTAAEKSYPPEERSRLRTQAELLNKPSAKRPSIAPSILEGKPEVAPSTIATGQAFTPRTEPEMTPKDRIAAERQRLIEMRANKDLTGDQPGTQALPERPTEPVENTGEGKPGHSNASMPSAAEKAYPSVQELHALAGSKGLDIEQPVFRELTKMITGVAHLDQLTPPQRQKMADKLNKLTGTPAPVTPKAKAEAPAQAVIQTETAPLSTFDAAQVPRGTLVPEQNAELLARAEKAQADLEIAGSERGGRYFNETQGKGSDQEITGLKSATAQWFKDATSGPASLSRKRVEVAVQKIIQDKGRDTGRDVQRIKELLLQDQEFNSSPFAPKTEADWNALIAEATHQPMPSQPDSVALQTSPADLPSPAIQDAPPRSETAPIPQSTPIQAEKAKLQKKPLNMAGETRKGKPPAAQSPNYLAIPAKTREKFEAAWTGSEQGDRPSIRTLKEWLYLSNKALRAEFERRAGVKLPKGLAATNAAVEAYFTKPAESVIPKEDSGSTSAPASEAPQASSRYKNLPEEVREGIEAWGGEKSINPKVAPLVYALNESGLQTRGSGDGYENSYVYVDLSEEAAIQAEVASLPEGWILTPRDMPSMKQDLGVEQMSQAHADQRAYLKKEGVPAPLERLARKGGAVSEEEARAIVEAIVSNKPEESSQSDSFSLTAPGGLKPTSKSNLREQMSIPVPPETIGTRPIIGREVEQGSAEAPLFSKAAQTPDAQQTAIPEPEAPTTILANALRAAADQIEGTKPNGKAALLGGEKLNAGIASLEKARDGMSRVTDNIGDRRQAPALLDVIDNLLEVQADPLTTETPSKLVQPNATSSERLFQRMLVDTKTLRNIMGSKVFLEQGFSGLDAKAQRLVLSNMRGLSHNGKVLDTVVELIPIDVMNDFSSKEFPAKVFLDNPTMLKRAIAHHLSLDVPLTADVADTLVQAFALGGAVERAGLTLPDLVGPTEKNGLTKDTVYSNHGNDNTRGERVGQESKATDQGTALFEERAGDVGGPTAAQFKEAWKTGARIEPTNNKVIDSSQQFPAGMMRDLATQGYVRTLAHGLDPVFKEMVRVFQATDPGFGSPSLVAFSPDDYYVGVNLRGPDGIILNPWGALWRTQADIRHEGLDPAKTPEYVAARLLKTMVHELTHQQVEGHDATFDQQLEVNYTALGDARLERLQQAIMTALEGGIDALSRDLNRQTPYWQDRAGLSDADRGRDAESRPIFNREDVVDQSGRTGPRPRSALRASREFETATLESRPTFQRRGPDDELNSKDSSGLDPQRHARIIGDAGRDYTPAQRAAMQRTGSMVTPKTLKDSLHALYQHAGKRMAQGLVDQFRPVRDISDKAYTLLRLSKGATGAFEAFMKHGKLSLNDGAYDADRTGGVIETVFAPLGRETTDFLRWVAGNRAERLKAEGKEHLFTSEDIAAFKSLADGTTDQPYALADGKETKDRTLIYRDALKKFNAFNTNVLDMAEQSGLIDGASRHLWEHEFYVPFYRTADENDGGVRGMNIKSGVVRQEAFKTLKGGEHQLNDLLENTLMNWAHLIDASAKNRAAQATLEAAVKLGIAHPAPQGSRHIVWYQGKRPDGTHGKVEYTVDDPYLLDALNGMEYAGLRGPAMDALSAMKHALTIGVTASPFFKIRNLIRDSVQAIATSDLSYNPLANVAKGVKLTDRDTQAYVSALAGGGLIRFGTMLEGSEAKRTRQLIKQGAKEGTILDSPHKVKDFYDRVIAPAIDAYNELGNRGEEINRMTLYDTLIKQGKGHDEASLMARDLMDFSMQGTWTTIRFLSQTVPFFNARLEGLYKLGRAAHADPKRFSIVVGAAAMASLALLAAYGDDDDWKKREDFDVENYWYFRIGGTAFRIPKPFEIGAIASLAERGAQLFTDKEMTPARFAQRLLAITGNQLAMNPIPQLVKPIIDLYANKDSFTGRPIETMGMERLAPDQRYRQSTSLVARGLSTAGNAITGDHFASPVQIDHLARAYFGWLGSFVVGAGDMLARTVSNEPTRPALDYWKVATGGMVAGTDGAHSRYVTQMYEQAKILEEAFGTYRHLLKEGKSAEAQSYRASHTDELSRYRRVEHVKTSAARLNERIRMVERSTMSADKKREQINEIRSQQDRLARQLVAP